MQLKFKGRAVSVQLKKTKTFPKKFFAELFFKKATASPVPHASPRSLVPSFPTLYFNGRMGWDGDVLSVYLGVEGDIGIIFHRTVLYHGDFNGILVIEDLGV